MIHGEGRRFGAREGTSGGMRGGVGLRVGGGVAMLGGEIDGEWCLRQLRMSVEGRRQGGNSDSCFTRLLAREKGPAPGRRGGIAGRLSRQ